MTDTSARIVQKLMVLLQRPPGRWSVLPRLPGTVDLPAAPQAGRRTGQTDRQRAAHSPRLPLGRLGQPPEGRHQVGGLLPEAPVRTRQAEGHVGVGLPEGPEQNPRPGQAAATGGGADRKGAVVSDGCRREGGMPTKGCWNGNAQDVKGEPDSISPLGP